MLSDRNLDKLLSLIGAIKPSDLDKFIKANDTNDCSSLSILTFDCPFNIEWEFKSITQCREV